MKPRAMFCFWLGSLDSRVAAGSPDVGGTHDIRFGWVGQELRAFIGQNPDESGRWHITLEAYPEAGLGVYALTIAEYGGVREGECALPTQYGGSGSEYSLWRKMTRPYSSQRTKARDAIVLIKDSAGKFHARMIQRELLQQLPKWMQDNLSPMQQRGHMIAVPANYELIDVPLITKLNIPFHVRKQIVDKQKLVARIKGMRGSTGKTLAARHRRSRQLAEELKRLYEFHCQLCEGSIPRIHIAGERYYVEVHHVYGFAEVDNRGGKAEPTQETSDLLIDQADNIMVVCPHHHMVLHYGHGGMIYDRANSRFLGHDGMVLSIQRNEHL